jgi:hypothetical protein
VDGIQITPTFLYHRGNEYGRKLSDMLRRELGMSQYVARRDDVRITRESPCDRSAMSQAPDYSPLTIVMIFGITLAFISGIVISIVYFIVVETNCARQFIGEHHINL